MRPFPGPGGQWQISTAGGDFLRWRHDGKELYYLAHDNRMMAAPIMAHGATIEPGTPASLFQTEVIGGGRDAGQRAYGVAPDGRFLINITTEETTAPPITLVINWKPPAK